MKKCLLIVPLSFYSFGENLKINLESRNYDVSILNDEYPSNLFGKIIGKLGLSLSLDITEKYILKCINGKTYDIVIIIKGRGMSTSLLRKISASSKKVIAYNFDSFSFHPSPLNWYKELDKFYTFDYRDSEKYGLPLLELFSTLPSSSISINRKYAISALMKNHSQRLQFLDEILSTIKDKNIYIYIYESNKISLLLNFFKNPFLYLKYWKHIFLKPLKYEEFVNVLETSDFTLDYAHPKQSGITIRCFEALETGTKIISNNEFILKNSNFSSDNVILFKSNTDRFCLKEKYDQMKNKLPEKRSRTIDNFIEELLS